MADVSETTEGLPIITRTDLGPMTTQFTPSPSCFQHYIYSSEAAEGGMDYVPEYGVKCVEGGESTYHKNCFPQTSLDPSTYEILSTYHPVYSPAFDCPKGFVSACTFARTDEAIGSQVIASSRILEVLRVGEVDVACCPEGYTCDEEDEITCRKKTMEEEVLSGTAFKSNCDIFTTTITMDDVQRTAYNYMQPIHIVTHATDIKPTSTTSNAETGTKASLEAATSASTSTGKPEVTRGGGSTIAIGIAVPFGVVILFGIAFFMFRRRKNKQRAEREALPRSEAAEAKEPGPTTLPQELHATSNISELPAVQQTQELPGDGSTTELAADPASKPKSPDNTEPELSPSENLPGTAQTPGGASDGSISPNPSATGGLPPPR